MKQLIDYSQQATAIKPPVCSEEKCITCFENRGCMYEQYMIEAVHNMENPYPAQQQYAGRILKKQADSNVN